MALNPDAFPRLEPDEMDALRHAAQVCEYHDGDVVFKAGQANLDFYVIESGELEIVNPVDDHRTIVRHLAGEFAGDIDLLTRRPVIVTAIARGEAVLLRVPFDKLRDLLNSIPRLGEKMMRAFYVRRQLLVERGIAGIRVVGPPRCRKTTVIREFLHKNFVPHIWYDPQLPDGQHQLERLGSPTKLPVVDCGEGTVLIDPTLQKLAKCAGIWRGCPIDHYDLAIVGAGPSGIATAVYAASEGLKTIVLDRLGPGGQAGSSSRIENFIGFPTGISGTELAERGVLQMLKFGATMIAPVNVEHLEPAPTPDAPHVLHLDCGAEVRADAVLVATGVAWRRLEVPGADQFERAGVYYACTAIESRQHDGTDVAVVGGGNSAGQAAVFLSEHCARTVHLLVRRELSATMSEYLADRIEASPNIKLHLGVEVSEVVGNRTIEYVQIRNRETGKTSRLDCTAVFVFIGAEPHVSWLPDSVARDELGYLLTGADAMQSGRWVLPERAPCPLETSLPRVMAAGDVRSGTTKRVGFAVGDGSLAVTCTHHLRMLRPAATVA